MKIHLVAVGNNMPDWVTKGFNEYAARLKNEVTVHLIEIPIGQRGKNADIPKAMQDEGKRLLNALPKEVYIVGLDVIAESVTTEKLSVHLDRWLHLGKDIAILIGGPDGFSKEVKDQFDMSLSLSNLTLPHPLVRIVIAEQIYRAWSILNNHPYHRA